MLIYWSVTISGPFVLVALAQRVPEGSRRWNYAFAAVFLAWLVFVLGAGGLWWGSILND